MLNHNVATPEASSCLFIAAGVTSRSYAIDERTGLTSEPHGLLASAQG
jgi:hypothetical protein